MAVLQRWDLACFPFSTRREDRDVALVQSMPNVLRVSIPEFQSWMEVLKYLANFDCFPKRRDPL